MPSVDLGGSSAWTITVSASQLNRLRPLGGTSAWVVTVSSAALQVSVRLAAQASIVFNALANLFYPPAITPAPAGFTPRLSQLVIAMPAPTLDAFGRPVQPWLPS